jgi:phosphonate transport system ATP-binding protein
MTGININKLTVAFGGRVALSNINLRIDPGERVAFIGPSGAGKTTLLQKIYEMVADHASFVHQQYGLVPQLTVFHNVYIGQLDRNPLWKNILNLIHACPTERREVEGILDILGLAGKLHQRVSSLSGGQQQRVAIGRAMYRNSPIILADEPVASIDPLQGEKVVRDLFSVGTTTVASLHSVNFARSFARRIIGIKSGKIEFDLPSERLTDQKIEELYS